MEVIGILFFALTLQLVAWYVSGRLHERMKKRCDTDSEQLSTFIWGLSLILRTIIVVIALGSTLSYVGYFWLGLLAAKLVYLRNKSEHELTKTAFGRLFLRLHAVDVNKYSRQ